MEKVSWCIWLVCTRRRTISHQKHQDSISAIPADATSVSNVFGTNIKITETNEVFHIKQHINCKSRNLIYCVTCKKCMEQYIGETEQELHSRSVGHLSDIRNDKPGLPYVTHFQKCGIEHYSITGIEKLRNSNKGFRKQRELFYKDYFQVRIKWIFCKEIRMNILNYCWKLLW